MRKISIISKFRALVLKSDLLLCIYFIITISIYKLFSIKVNGLNAFALEGLVPYVLPVTVSCIIFSLIFFDKIDFKSNGKFFDHFHWNIHLYLIVFYILTAANLITLNASLYYQPISFTYLLITNGLILFLIIYSIQNRIGNQYTRVSILISIIIFSVIVRSYYYDLYPLTFGGDVWYHLKLTDLICQSGSLESLRYYVYSYYPLMSLSIAITRLVLGVSLVSAELFSTTLSCSVSIIFIFLIADSLIKDIRVSLFSTFLVSISGIHISHSFGLVGLTMGFIFAPMLIYLISANIDKLDVRYSLLILIFLLVLVLSHPNSCVMIEAMLLIFYLISYLYSCAYGDNFKVSFLIPIIFGISMVSYWIFITGFFKFLKTFSSNIAFKLAGEVNIITSGEDNFNFALMQKILLAIIIFFMIFGMLRIFQTNNRKCIAIFYMAFIMYFVGVVLSQFQLDSLLPYRWSALGLIFGAIIIAYGFFEYSEIKTLNYLSLMLIIIYICFSLGGYGINYPHYGDKLFSAETSLSRVGLSYPEIYTSYFVSNYYDNVDIYSDQIFLNFLNIMYYNNTLSEKSAENLFYTNYNYSGLFIYREYMAKSPLQINSNQTAEFLVRREYRKLSRDPKVELNNNIFANIIYDSVYTKCYYLIDNNRL